jgi:hypothetical protein
MVGVVALREGPASYGRWKEKPGFPRTITSIGYEVEEAVVVWPLGKVAWYVKSGCLM